MAAIYCTYSQNGILKRGVLSPTQYEKYSKDPSISNLQVYASQAFMEESYNSIKGVKSNPKSILFG